MSIPLSNILSLLLLMLLLLYHSHLPTNVNMDDVHHDKRYTNHLKTFVVDCSILKLPLHCIQLANLLLFLPTRITPQSVEYWPTAAISSQVVPFSLPLKPYKIYLLPVSFQTISYAHFLSAFCITWLHFLTWPLN